MPAGSPALWVAALASVLIATLAVAPFRAASGGPATVAHEARALGSSRDGLTGLPVAARGAISAALGADSAAYRASATPGGFQTRSRAQGVRARFARSGVELSSGAVELSLGLRAIGNGSSLRAVGPVTPTAKLNRVNYVRAGVTEWYANGPAGVEQGFTVSRAPGGEARGALTLSMALATDAHAAPARDGQSISFIGARGEALRYGGLTAVDSTGRHLPSRMALQGRAVLLRVETAGARYPLRVDPLIEQGGKLTGSGASGEVPAQFGTSTALSQDGNTALIAGTADGDHRGAVWVFTRSASGWSQQGEKLTSGNEGESAQEQCAEEPAEPEECSFGSSVALSADGNTALIGDPSAGSRHGIALVFTRSGSEWSQVATLSGTAESGEGRFGKSVALSADGATALIGDPSAELGRGAAWVFVRSGSGWLQQGASVWTGERPVLAHVGRSVALSADGNTALIGAPGYSGYVGTARVFTRAGSGWSAVGEALTGAEEDGEAHFGKTVALSGNGETALIAGPTDNLGLGAVWVFIHSGSAFVAQGGKLTGSKASGEAHFGSSTALSYDGGTALIGAPREQAGAGAVSVLMRSGSSWTELGEQLAGGEALGKGWSGAAVALSGDGETALFGAPRDGARAGAAWVFANTVPTRPPTVSDVRPGAGPASGGTAVTISGTNFTGATAVSFGATDAPGFVVESATTIKVVTPAAPHGIVDVRVTTPAGTSAVGRADQFRFEKAESPEVSGSSGPPSAATPSGGVLGFTGASAAIAGCRVSLRSGHLAVQLRRVAALRLVRTGTGACRGTVTLRHKSRTKGAQSKLQTIGTSAFSIAGTSQVVRITLNKLGRTLFRTHHGRLNVSLSIVRRAPAPIVGSTSSVRLTRKKTPRQKPTAK